MLCLRSSKSLHYNRSRWLDLRKNQNPEGTWNKLQAPHSKSECLCTYNQIAASHLAMMYSPLGMEILGQKGPLGNTNLLGSAAELHIREGSRSTEHVESSCHRTVVHSNVARMRPGTPAQLNVFGSSEI